VLQVSNRSPRKGRGIRIAFQLPDSAVPNGPPVLRLEDAQGASYRCTMQPGDQLGEWVWTSGLDVVGGWTGFVNARCGSRTVSAKLPRITVVP
jgi:hypothetical protein